MAVQHVTLLHCDRHIATEKVETGDAETVTVSINGVERKVEFCPPCIKELVEPLRAAMTDYGRKPAAATSKPAKKGSPRYDCPVPDCEERPTGLRSHVRTVHGVDAERQYMPTATAFPCREPNCGRELGGSQGLGLHLRRAHGITEPAAVYLARHGVVAP